MFILYIPQQQLKANCSWVGNYGKILSKLVENLKQRHCIAKIQHKRKFDFSSISLCHRCNNGKYKNIWETTETWLWVSNWIYSGKQYGIYCKFVYSANLNEKKTQKKHNFSGQLARRRTNTIGSILVATWATRSWRKLRKRIQVEVRRH